MEDNVNALQFYNEMKRALNFFGLDFNEKEKMQIEVSGDYVRFMYQNDTIILDTAKWDK